MSNDGSINSKMIVHHIDGIEMNNDEENLMRVPDRNIHNLLHRLELTGRGSSFQWEGSVDVLVYDGTSYKKRKNDNRSKDLIKSQHRYNLRGR